MTCPRCRGRVMRFLDEPSCLSCGWVYYHDLATVERMVREEGAKGGPRRRAQTPTYDAEQVAARYDERQARYRRRKRTTLAEWREAGERVAAQS